MQKIFLSFYLKEEIKIDKNNKSLIIRNTASATITIQKPFSH
jgi:hypothetical protein